MASVLCHNGAGRACAHARNAARQPAASLSRLVLPSQRHTGHLRCPQTCLSREGSCSAAAWTRTDSPLADSTTSGDEERAASDDLSSWTTSLTGLDQGEDPDLERVFLVGVQCTNSPAQSIVSLNGNGSKAAVSASDSGLMGGSEFSIHDSLDELSRLAQTAGLQVVGRTHQSLPSVHPSTYVGSGKLAEVARSVRALGADTLLVDDELSPAQQRNLERTVGGQEGLVRVCDRTALILDIFSQRAQTREGKLQVELASAQYQLPRLTRLWSHLDRVGGGGQVKGSGEKQKEVDKRILRKRLQQLQRELEGVRTQRARYRARRQETPIPVIALVGYTNAGKSTLMNAVTKADVLAEDKLFATLDPTTRRVRLRGATEVLLSDTVGFIQKLPTQLVAAFRATLEEVRDATLLLHVVDASSPYAAAQAAAVEQVLHDMGADNLPRLTVFNKIDAAEDVDSLRDIADERPDTLCVSAQTGDGIKGLLDACARKLQASMYEVTLLVPYSAGEVLPLVHAQGVVRHLTYEADGVRVQAALPAAALGRVRDYVVGELPELPRRPTRDDDARFLAADMLPVLHDLYADGDDTEDEAEDGWFPV